MATLSTYCRAGKIFIMFLFFAATVKVQGQALPRPDHIVVLIEENEPNTLIVGGQGVSWAPDINALANDSNSAVFSHMYAIEHPSQPDYFDLFAGGNQGITSDNVPLHYPFTTPNMARELVDKGLTFATYSEDLPYAGSQDTVSQAGSYARKHNPVTNWAWADSANPGANQVSPLLSQPFTAFPYNFSQLPTVSYVVPDEDSDMHDGLFPTLVSAGDLWFCEHLQCYSATSLTDWARTHNTLFILTFDEDDGLFDNNIPTIFFGPMVKGGTYSDQWNLYNILRTIEDMYGLDHAGAAADAVPITNVWKTESTGIDNALASASGLKVYPNPASSLIYFDAPRLGSANSEISVSDVTGRSLGKFPISAAQKLSISTADYAPGVYFYHLNQNNTLVESGKFIVTH
jgi:acid phosphatase